MTINAKKIVYITSVETKFGLFTLVATDKGLCKASLPLTNQESFIKQLHNKFDVRNESNTILNQACDELPIKEKISLFH